MDTKVTNSEVFRAGVGTSVRRKDGWVASISSYGDKVDLFPLGPFPTSKMSLDELEALVKTRAAK